MLPALLLLPPLGVFFTFSGSIQTIHSKEVSAYNSFSEFYLIVQKEMQGGDLYEL